MKDNEKQRGVSYLLFDGKNMWGYYFLNLDILEAMPFSTKCTHFNKRIKVERWWPFNYNC